MDGFIIFLIFAFIVIPVIKNLAGAKPTPKSKRRRPSPRQASGIPNPATKNWAEVQKNLQQKIQVENGNPVFKKNQRDARDKHGHSNSRQNTHQNLHARDGNQNVFPEDHQARVRKRDNRDRNTRNKIETAIHNKSNRAIYQDGNRSIDGWGRRGDKSGGNGFIFLTLSALIALLGLSYIVPELWADILAKFGIA